MQLLNKPRLLAAAEAADDDLAGRLRAWAAEVREGKWKSDAEFRARYPKAKAIAAGHFELFLDQAGSCVELLLDYKLKIALITFAGRRVTETFPIKHAARERWS